MFKAAPRFIAISIACISAGTASLFYSNQARGPANTYADYSQKIASKSYQAFKDISSEDLQNLIRDNPQADTVESFLSLLPSDFMNSYTLANRSKSLQPANAQNPRAIVFGKTGQTTIAFDGGGKDSTESIEVMAWNSDKKTFEFSEILFEKNRGPYVSPEGGSNCIQCHRNGEVGLLPRWDPYDKWENFYGEEDDFIEKQSKEFSNFKKRQPTHPRYQFLGHKNKHAAFPYYSKEVKVFKETDLQSVHGRNLFNMPNLRLTIALSSKTVQQSLAYVNEKELQDLAKIFAVTDCKDKLYASAYKIIKNTYGKKASRYLAPSVEHEKMEELLELLLKVGLEKRFGIDRRGLTSYPGTPNFSISEMIGSKMGLSRSALRRDRGFSAHNKDAYSIYYMGETYNTGISNLYNTFRDEWIQQHFANEPWLDALKKSLFEAQVELQNNPANKNNFLTNLVEFGASYPVFEEVNGCSTNFNKKVKITELNRKLMTEALEAYLRTIDYAFR